MGRAILYLKSLRCHISQSAISQQVQALERELGTQLLHRSGRRFTLTAAGEHFYQKGRPLLDGMNRLCRETSELGGVSTPRLRIGYLRCYSGLEFQMAVAEFARQSPEVPVEISNGSCTTRCGSAPWTWCSMTSAGPFPMCM